MKKIQNNENENMKEVIRKKRPLNVWEINLLLP
jgi:hypothetical protein